MFTLRWRVPINVLCPYYPQPLFRILIAVFIIVPLLSSSAVREDRMPGGRNSGAVYNLYKVRLLHGRPSCIPFAVFPSRACDAKATTYFGGLFLAWEVTLFGLIQSYYVLDKDNICCRLKFRYFPACLVPCGASCLWNYTLFMVKSQRSPAPFSVSLASLYGSRAPLRVIGQFICKPLPLANSGRV